MKCWQTQRSMTRHVRRASCRHWWNRKLHQALVDWAEKETFGLSNHSSSFSSHPISFSVLLERRQSGNTGLVRCWCSRVSVAGLWVKFSFVLRQLRVFRVIQRKKWPLNYLERASRKKVTQSFFNSLQKCTLQIFYLSPLVQSHQALRQVWKS